MSEYAAIPYAYGEIERRTLFDREKNTYLLYVVGWDGSERVHGINIHVDIIGGKSGFSATARKTALRWIWKQRVFRKAILFLPFTRLNCENIPNTQLLEILWEKLI